MKETPEHKDKLGKIINIDDVVAYSSHNSLVIGKVVKLNNKMVKMVKLPAGKRNDSGTNKYPVDVVKLNPEDVTFYLLIGKER